MDALSCFKKFCRVICLQLHNLPRQIDILFDQSVVALLQLLCELLAFSRIILYTSFGVVHLLLVELLLVADVLGQGEDLGPQVVVPCIE